MFVGIDISQEFVDVDVCQGPASWAARRPNTPSAAKKLSRQLRSATLVVLESSGGCERTLVQALHKHQVPLSVVNPRWVRRFAQSKGYLAKTDALDARILAEYAQDNHTRLNRQVPCSQQQIELKALVALRQDLVQSRVQYKNRLKQADLPSVRSQLTALLE